ncbi:MAG: hypothetical protein OEZ34_10045 [Spirochaetia bacterium]|nr:hypothetical protein [Spirochaetia bacterium]
MKKQINLRLLKLRFIRILLAMLFSLIAISVLSCDKILEAGMDFLASQKKEVKGSMGLVKVSAPGNWVEMTDLNDEANLQIGNVFEEGYLIVISESKDDFDKMNLEEYSRITFEPLYEGLSKRRQEKPEVFRIGNHDAIKRDLEGVIDNININYIHAVTETEKNFHQIVGWSLKSKFETNKPILEEIINSFQEL